MTASKHYLEHHLQLLIDLYQTCLEQPPFNLEEASDTDRDILAGLKTLSEANVVTDDFTQLGQASLTRIIANYPHITPYINRDLLWFFGGDCLHFMGDDELALYQQIDELMHEQAALTYIEAKASIFQLH